MQRPTSAQSAWPAPSSRNGPSLGTMAMARNQRSFESHGYSSSSDEADSLKLHEPAFLPEPHRFPPSPTAYEPEVPRNGLGIRFSPRPVRALPQIVVPPPLADLPDNPPTPPPKSPFFERVQSTRRTLMGKVDGWWDLNLLDKRQTLFGGGSGSPARHKG